MMHTTRSIRTAFLALAVSSLPGVAWTQSTPEVRIRGRQFVAGDAPFLIKGIHYGPWRPGTGPNKAYPYPPIEGIAGDFDLIRRAHANTVLLYDAPASVLDLADRRGLKVLYTFALDWWAVGGERQPEIRAQVVERVKALRGRPALLGWVLGNEVPEAAIQERGADRIVEGLRDLYDAVKRIDPAHPVSHANWPPAKDLDLGFLDFVSFNLYPLWPPEVVATGFGPYIAQVLRPLAHDKPLLLTEFGVNTIEATADRQAQLLRSSWTGLVDAGAAGGVVFEFADEWWKNYDNPVRTGNWWVRRQAPDDELRHDEDPEESYGLMTADRRPKPAYDAIAEAFATSSDQERTGHAVGLVLVSSLTAVAGVLWLGAARRRRERRRPLPART